MRKRLRKKLARREAYEIFYDAIWNVRLHGTRIWSYAIDEPFDRDIRYLGYTCKPKCLCAKQCSIPYLKELKRREDGEVTRHYIDSKHVAWY